MAPLNDSCQVRRASQGRLEILLNRVEDIAQERTWETTLHDERNFKSYIRFNQHDARQSPPSQALYCNQNAPVQDIAIASPGPCCRPIYNPFTKSPILTPSVSAMILSV